MTTIAAYSTSIAVRPATYDAIDRLCTAMRDCGRDELVHYAGAACRDHFAWLVCQAWLSSGAPSFVSEAQLRLEAHHARGDRHVTLQQMEAAYPPAYPPAAVGN